MAGLTVRALGSGHSFTPAAATSGAALDLSGWAGVISADAGSGLVTVRSGTTIRQLNASLDVLGLAMPNLGDIDAQTIAGTISTGTHGTGARLGGIAAAVAALESSSPTGRSSPARRSSGPACLPPPRWASAPSA